MLGLAGCQQPGEQSFSYWEERRTAGDATQRLEVRTVGRVIDQAEVLTPEEEQRIGKTAQEVGQAGRRVVLVLTVPPLGQESLEQFGWAINGQRRDGGTVLLMVRPDDGTVRIETGGSLSPEQAAAVASAIRPDLRRRAAAPAIERGLATLEKLWATSA